MAGVLAARNGGKRASLPQVLEAVLQLESALGSRVLLFGGVGQWGDGRVLRAMCMLLVCRTLHMTSHLAYSQPRDGSGMMVKRRIFPGVARGR